MSAAEPALSPPESSASSRPAPVAKTQTAPRVSVVVPALNEADSLEELTKGVRANLEKIGATFEIVFVDDGSTDDSWRVITELHEADPRVSGVRLRSNFGKAVGLTTGFARARGEIIVTMDADLQDDPAELPKFLEAIEKGSDCVVGWKVKRLDPANRLVLTRIFNGTVRWLTGVKLHDMNCGFKAYRREVLRVLPIYGDLFRFIPAFAKWQGFKISEVPVTHHARKFGKSRYGLERVFRGFFDLLSVLFLTRYSKKPMHLFGLVGLLLTLVGVLTEGYLSVLWLHGQKIGDRPLLLLGALEIILGIQFFSIGLLGEFLTFQNHQRRLDAPDLPIREETR